MMELRLSYTVFRSVVGTALPMYWQQRSDGSYQLYAIGDTHALLSEAKSAEEIADFEGDGKSLQNLVASFDEALALGYYTFNGNALSVPKAADGRLIVRHTTANKAKNFNLRAIHLRCGKLNSVRSIDPRTEEPYGDVTLKLYHVVEDELTEITDPADEALATRTVVDFEPAYSYEIIGGWIDVPPNVQNGETDEWWLSVVALPDYIQYGIAIDFVSEVNLEATTGRIVSDGRATNFLPYTNVGGTNYHTNKIRFTFKHPAGVNERFQLFLELFDNEGA